MQLDDVWRYHLRVSSVVPKLDDPGLTQAELAQVRDELRDENERVIVLLLVAAAEANLQKQAAAIAASAANPFESEMQKVVKAAARNSPYLGAILKVWKTYPTASANLCGSIADFEALQKVRHWLAHGRHWDTPKMVDPGQAWVNIEKLFHELNLNMPVKPTRIL